MARILFAATLGLLLGLPAFPKGKPIPVKVVVIAMFERGADTGDEPGELQYWVERNRLDRIIPFAGRPAGRAPTPSTARSHVTGRPLLPEVPRVLGRYEAEYLDI